MINISAYSVEAAEKTALESMLSLTGTNPTLEQLWELMDQAWQRYGCDNRSPKTDRLSSFYSDPVWLLNGMTHSPNPLAHRSLALPTAAGGGAAFSSGGRAAQTTANGAPGGAGTAERERNPHTRGPVPERGAASAYLQSRRGRLQPAAERNPASEGARPRLVRTVRRGLPARWSASVTPSNDSGRRPRTLSARGRSPTDKRPS